MDLLNLLKDPNITQYEEIFIHKGYADLEHNISINESNMNDLLLDVGRDNNPSPKKQFLTTLIIHKSTEDITFVNVNDSPQILQTRKHPCTVTMLKLTLHQLQAQE